MIWAKVSSASSASTTSISEKKNKNQLTYQIPINSINVLLGTVRTIGLHIIFDKLISHFFLQFLVLEPNTLSAE